MGIYLPMWHRRVIGNLGATMPQCLVSHLAGQPQASYIGSPYLCFMSINFDDLDGWDGGWKRGLRVRGYIYTYSWFTFLDSRNEHNIVRQLYTIFFLINKASTTATTKTTYTIGLMWVFHESVCERYWKQCLAHRQVCSMCISSCEVSEPITVRTYWI